MGAVAECQQGGRGILSADNNFTKEGKEVRLVEMNDDVVAPSVRAFSDMKSLIFCPGHCYSSHVDKVWEIPNQAQKISG